MKKLDVLLASKLTGYADLSGLLEESKKDRLKLEDELGRLVEVHVDEPNYDEVVQSLLLVFKEHVTFTERFLTMVRTSISKDDLANLNAQLTNIVLHSTDFNSVQPL